MPLEDPRGERLDGPAVADVARLGLAADLLGQLRSRSSRRATRMQCHPRVASRRAVASPMPEEAPVIDRDPLHGANYQMSSSSVSPQPTLRAAR